MILQKEIITIAEQKGVLKSTIDKDWVLGHFLGAIYSEPKLREALIFKGGTCLKKCWFRSGIYFKHLYQVFKNELV